MTDDSGVLNDAVEDDGCGPAARERVTRADRRGAAAARAADLRRDGHGGDRRPVPEHPGSARSRMRAQGSGPAGTGRGRPDHRLPGRAARRRGRAHRRRTPGRSGPPRPAGTDRHLHRTQPRRPGTDPAVHCRPPPHLGAPAAPAVPGPGEGVAATIRRRRLEHCHADLARPELLDRPVHAIAARWGFSSAAVFSRAYRQAYGTSPTARRAQARADVPCRARPVIRTGDNASWTRRHCTN